MYNKVEEIPVEILNLPLEELNKKFKEWGIPRKEIMKKRRRLKGNLYTRRSRFKFTKTVENVGTILIQLNKENQKLTDYINLLEEEIKQLKMNQNTIFDLYL